MGSIYEGVALEGGHPLARKSSRTDACPAPETSNHFHFSAYIATPRHPPTPNTLVPPSTGLYDLLSTEAANAIGTKTTVLARPPSGRTARRARAPQ
jgi:hypothetical protein